MQIGFFDGSEKFKNNKPIRLIELFGGIQAQATALHELGVEFEHYRYIDFDKYAVKSANAMYETNFEPRDITKLTAEDLVINETDKYTYIMTYSFPCTDLSLAGKGLGMAKGSGTRSGLLWEVERLLLEMQERPQVLLMENVPEVIGTKNMPHFAEWLKALEQMGYKNYWQNLKATDFGIPQSRERTFMVSLLGDYYYNFPKPFELKLRLKDLLEQNVDEKYYLSDKLLNYHIKRNNDNGHFGVFNPEKKEHAKIARTIHNTGLNRTDDNFIIENKLVQVGELDIKGNDSIKRVYSQNGLSPTLTTMEGGNRQPKIQVFENKSIRKLTPKECWRLMGFKDEQFDKAQKVNSNSQLYKQAGNSIVVTVLMAIFGELLGIEWQEKVKKLIDFIQAI